MQSLVGVEREGDFELWLVGVVKEQTDEIEQQHQIGPVFYIFRDFSLFLNQVNQMAPLYET